jgi:hypothetical protein
MSPRFSKILRRSLAALVIVGLVAGFWLRGRHRRGPPVATAPQANPVRKVQPPSTPVAVPSAKAPPVRLALAVDVVTNVYVQTTPNATCVLDAGEPARPMPVIANDVGIAHFTLKPRHEGAATVFLDCRGADGTSMRYPLDLSGTSDAAALAATRTSMEALARIPHGTPRPPLVGDPMSYKQSDLLARGYGRRPDPKAQPDRYARWLGGAQQPGTIISGVGVKTNRSNNSWSGSDSGGGWSGAIVTNPAGIGVGTGQGCNPPPPQQLPALFNDAAAEWVVPQVFAESSIGNYSSASTWAGLGGANGNSDLPLWQAGTGESTQSALWFESSSYDAWWQAFTPANPNQNTISMSVNNGDQVEAEVWVCDPTQSSTATGPAAPNAALCAWIHNYTQNEDWVLPNPQSTASQSATSSFLTAEVIQEWNNGGANDYAQFNKFMFSNTGICSTANISGNCLGGSDPHSDPFAILVSVGSVAAIDGYVTTMWNIGTPSDPIGQSCLGDSTGNCNDNGDLVWVWWNSHKG